MQVEPYLYFNGRCEEAIEFYRRSVGATLNVLTRFKDVPGSQAPAGAENKVLHADFKIGDTTILASDGECDGKPNFQGFSLAITVETDADADRLFETFCDGGRVQVPMTPTPFASRFGMVADRFGVLWTIVTNEQTASANA